MFSSHFPIPAEDILIPPKFILGFPLLKASKLYGFHRRRPYNLRLRASDATAAKSQLKIVNDNSAAAVVSGVLQEEVGLPAELKKEVMPKHVAVILDGNVRWARQKKLPDSMGHDAGVRSVRNMIDLCYRWDIPVLTVFAFSYDNWVRSEGEVGFLMVLFERVLKTELENCMRRGIRISVIGDLSRFPKPLQTLINEAVERSKDNTKLQLIVAASYSGRYDVVQACKNIAQKAKDNVVQIEDINETLIEQELETKCTDYPYPDLMIRTSGELRISNFLLWQMAYTEFFFSDVLWPDFGEDELVKALASYQKRQRRYGGRKSPTKGIQA